MRENLAVRLDWSPVTADFAQVCPTGFRFRMEPIFWESLNQICEIEKMAPQALVAQARKAYPGYPTNSAVRLHVAGYFLQKSQAPVEVVQTLDSMVVEHSPGSVFEADALPKNKAHILLVDDDPDVLTVLTAGLLKAEFEVTAAKGADDALRSLVNGRDFSAIVTDFAMVGMSGVQLVAQIRERCPRLPAIVISGYITSAAYEAEVLGVECLAKPFRQNDLVEKINMIIARREALEKDLVTGLVASDTVQVS